MLQRVLLFLFLLCCLAACDLGGSPAATPTPVPSATAVSQVVATDTPLPPLALATLTPVPIADTATPVPIADTATPVPTVAESTATPVEATQSPAPTPGTTSTASAALSPEATIAPATLQQLATIETQTAGIRGLKPKATVPAHFISSTQMQANLTDQLNTDYPLADARRDALELWLLRLIQDRNIDLHQVQVDLLGEQVIGYYSPDDKELFVLADQQPLDPQGKTTLSHEFTHALQDQYFDLRKLQPKDRHNNDQNSAVQALYEGDATVEQTLFDLRYLSQTELQKLIEQSSNAPTTALDKAPPYIRDGLVFPYEQGLEFVSELYKQGGFAEVDKAFRDPPTSTEQILHPERYLATPRDTPIAVSVPPLTNTLGAGWTLSDSNNLGEFDLAEMLKVNGVGTPTPVDPSVQAAAPVVEGYGGAQYALYQGQGAAVLLLITRWDSTGAANSFNTALHQSFATANPEGDLWTDNGLVFGTKHSGDQVVYAGGTDKDTVTKALASVK
jgi:hypothetical protein